MTDDAHHINEILRLYSEDLVPAIAKLAELKGSIQSILKELEFGAEGIRTRFLEGLHKGIRDHSESGRKLTESVEATRIELLVLQTELSKVVAESVGRDLKAARDAILENGYLVASDAARVASLKVLTPEVDRIVRAVNELGTKLNDEAFRASENIAAVVEKLQMDVATINWQRWFGVGVLVFLMAFAGTGVWRVVDNVWPWKLTPEQASALRIGQTLSDRWENLDVGSQKAIQNILK